MGITIQTIETKEFKVKPSGYDPEEVDLFLDSIIDEFEDMEQEIQSLRAAAARKPAASTTTIASSSTDSTEAAQKLLANAQRVSDETMNDARKQAEKIVAEAEARADRILEDARREAGRLQDSLDTLREAANDYRERFKRLVDDQMHLLNAETQLFD